MFLPTVFIFKKPSIYLLIFPLACKFFKLFLFLFILLVSVTTTCLTQDSKINLNSIEYLLRANCVSSGRLGPGMQDE